MLAAENGSAACRDRLRQVLSFVEDRGLVGRDELVEFVNGTTCPVGHDVHWASLSNMLLEARAGDALVLSAGGGDWLIENGRPAPEWAKIAKESGSPLRAWQARALRAWCDHGRRGVVQAVTGTGKSRVGVEAAREALSHDFSVVVVVPTVDLVEQWVKTLRRAKIDGVGVSADGHRATFLSHSVVVGTVQSLYLEPPQREDGKVLVIADECHRYGAQQWGLVLHPSYRRRLGLTATFERNDDGIEGLLRYFGGAPVFDIGFREAITEGVIARYDVRLLGVELTPAERRDYDDAAEMLRDARMKLLAADFPAEPFGAFLYEVQKAADYDEDPTIEDAARRYLKGFAKRIEVMTDASAKLNAVQHLARLVEASSGALLFTRRVDTAEDIAEALRVEGVRAAPIHSDLSRAERRERLSELRACRLKALVAPTVLDEGIDVPEIDLAVVLGGSKSRRQMIQRMGRVLRQKPDGRKATFVVVYAKDTAEDLTQSNGEEGCLDLIVDAADSVTTFESPIEMSVSPPTAAIGVESLEERGVVDGSTAQRRPAGDESGQTVDPRVSALDPTELSMTRRALRAFQARHGGTEARAEAELRAMLADFRQACVVRESSTPGVLVARREGFGLALASDRFVSYQSRHGDERTWSEIRADAAQESVAQQVVQADPDTADPAPGGEPGPLEPSRGAEERHVAREHADQPGTADAAEGPASGQIVRDLDRLVELRREGLLTESEFSAAKARILF
ncbi:DEAD/DEAH box helicase family protein [Nostocoides sp. Soil756]|uniref:DEAD/DEAH box helicase family protein n=1 Tax=Nostocoides sp. Soil756 TaxID=1736399 RepID=UPI0007009A0D|nr:DEAD/DEAH box helicase family protein [Tetrasphaera sp. Soil756]KRE61573.1 hypothetical protein ASG78_09425 [Tetrasphaera sp. Soil756]